MQIHEIFSVAYTNTDALAIEVDFTGGDGLRGVCLYFYRVSDKYSPLTPIITQWLADHNPEILPYVPPAPWTSEELRAQIPDKSLREFRDILTDMGIFPHMVTEKINEIPFDIERQKALNAWETSSFVSRTDPYIDMIGAMFDKTPTDIDVAWLV